MVNNSGSATVSINPQFLGFLQQMAGLLPQQLQDTLAALIGSPSQQIATNQVINQAAGGLGNFMSLLASGGLSNVTALTEALQQSGIINANQSASVAQAITLATGVATSASSDRCTRDMITMVTSIQGATTGVTAGGPTGDLSALWPLVMLDASGKPGVSILSGNNKFHGNYIQCGTVQHDYPIQQGFKGTICRSYMTFAIGPISFGANPLAPALEWDFCLPDSCTTEGLNGAMATLGISAGWQCTEDLDITEDTPAMVACFVLAMFGVMAVLGTFMEVFVTSSTPRAASYETSKAGAVITRPNKDGHDNKGYDAGLPNGNGIDTGKVNMKWEGIGQSQSMKVIPQEDGTFVPVDTMPSNGGQAVGKEQAPAKKNEEAHLSTFQRVLLAFSLPRNTGQIMSVKAGRGNIGCLHGIRVMSLGWVILGHVLSSLLNGAMVNKFDMYAELQSLSFQLVNNATLAVDTFFFMSGFLVAYLFLKHSAPKGFVEGKTMVLYYVHRYLRLTPSMMIWIMIQATIVTYIGEGRPAWKEFQGAPPCRETWWHNLLYINSVTDKGLNCVGQTWYLANDMIYYILAPLALIPWVFKNKTFHLVGFFSALSLLAIHVSTSMWQEIGNDVNGDMFRNQPEYMDKIYFKPWTRSGPYAIGLVFGYIYYHTKGKLNMSKCMVGLCWIVAIAGSLTLCLVTHDENKNLMTDPTGWSRTGRAIFETFSRPLWAVIVGWVVLACATGNGGFINSILSWQGWLPLSRLSYSAYLTHLTLIGFELGGLEAPMIFTWTIVIYQFLAYYVLSYGVGFLLTAFVEWPLQGLEKILISK